MRNKRSSCNSHPPAPWRASERTSRVAVVVISSLAHRPSVASARFTSQSVKRRRCCLPPPSLPLSHKAMAGRPKHRYVVAGTMYVVQVRVEAALESISHNTFAFSR